MWILVILLQAVQSIVSIIFFFLIICLVIRVVISWFNPDPFNPIVQYLSTVVDPMINWIRRVLPFRLNIGVFDLSPLILLILLQVVQQIAVQGLERIILQIS